MHFDLRRKILAANAATAATAEEEMCVEEVLTRLLLGAAVAAPAAREF